MGGIARKALRHPITWLLAAATVCAAAPGVALAATPDPSPPNPGAPIAAPRPDPVPSGRSLAQPVRPAGTTAPVRRVVVAPTAPRVVRVVTTAPVTARAAGRPRTVQPKQARPARPRPKPQPVQTRESRVVRIAGEPREAIVRAVSARTTDPLPLFLAAAGLAVVALAGGGVAIAVGRELKAL
jgi:hypothetical protein